MKNILYLIAVLLLVATSCKKDDPLPANKVDILPPDVDPTKPVTTGNFTGSMSYSVSGKVSLLTGTDKLVLSFEDFKSSSGPDLKVYLAKSTDGRSGFISLGALKATSGAFNYEVDKSTYNSDYKYVLIWCERFSALFGYAEIKPPTM